MPLPEGTLVFLAAFVISALAGLAALLRSNQPLSFRVMFSALLNSGLLGLSIGFLWYKSSASEIPFLLGICLLAGLGGATVFDFVLSLARKSGVKIVVHTSEDDAHERTPGG